MKLYCKLIKRYITTKVLSIMVQLKSYDAEVITLSIHTLNESTNKTAFFFFFYWKDLFFLFLFLFSFLFFCSVKMT